MVLGQTPEAPALASLFGLLLMVLGFLFVASAYGLWTVQDWGRAFASWIYAASIPLGILAMFPIFPSQRPSLGNALLQLAGIAIDVIIIAYLALPATRQFFDSDTLASDGDKYERIEPR